MLRPRHALLNEQQRDHPGQRGHQDRRDAKRQACATSARCGAGGAAARHGLHGPHRDHRRRSRRRRRGGLGHRPRPGPPPATRVGGGRRPSSPTRVSRRRFAGRRVIRNHFPGRSAPALRAAKSCLPWIHHQVYPRLRGATLLEPSANTPVPPAGSTNTPVLESYVSASGRWPAGRRLRGQRYGASAGGGTAGWRRRASGVSCRTAARSGPAARSTAAAVAARCRWAVPVAGTARSARVRAPAAHRAATAPTAAPGRSRPAAGCRELVVRRDRSGRIGDRRAVRHRRAAPRVAAERHVAARVAAQLDGRRPLAGELLARIVARSAHHRGIVLRASCSTCRWVGRAVSRRRASGSTAAG